MARSVFLAALAVLLAVAGSAGPARGQDLLPFDPGEKMEYEVHLGAFGTVGEGSMEVLGVDTVRAHPTFHLRMRVKGGVLFAKVNDQLDSWADRRTLAVRRIDHRIKEVNHKRHRTIDFFPEERRWVQEQGGKSGELSTDLPLDEVSFVYFARTLPLEVGRTYTFDRYYKPNGNPVVLRVLRTETVEVPAGRFETIVVQPTIKSGGLFGQGGEAELYFTNDPRRLLVKLRSKMPVVGSLRLELKSYSPGRPLAQAAEEMQTGAPDAPAPVADSPTEALAEAPPTSVPQSGRTE
jgi:hypothetical protein